MGEIRAALAAAVLTSAVVGTLIMLTDGYLWAAAPSHAYGLIAFIALDVALVIALWKNTRFAGMAGMFLAAVQVAAMAADILTYSAPGVSQQAFRTYLLNNSPFITLLVIQIVILGLAFGVTKIRDEYGMMVKWIKGSILRPA